MAGFEDLPDIDLTLFADEIRTQSFIEFISIQNEIDTKLAIDYSQAVLRGSILNWNQHAYSTMSCIASRFAANNEIWIPYCLYYRAWYIFLLGDHKDAIKLFLECENKFKSLGLFEDSSEAKISLGRINQSRGNWEKAIQCYDTAILKLNQIHSTRTRSIAFALHSKSDIHVHNLEMNQAQNSLIKAIDMLSGTDKKSLSFGLSTAYRNLGNIFRNQGKWNKALTNYGKSKEEAKTQKNIGEEAHTLNCMAITYLRMGKSEMARQYAMRSLMTHTDIQDNTWRALDLAVHGEISVFNNQNDDGMRLYDQAIDLLQSSHDMSLLLGVFAKKIFLLIKQKRCGEANEMIEEGRKFMIDLRIKKIETLLFELEGLLNICFGKMAKARKLLRKCLKIYVKSNLYHKKADIYWLLSKTYKNQNSILSSFYRMKSESLLRNKIYFSQYMNGIDLNLYIQEGK